MIECRQWSFCVLAVYWAQQGSITCQRAAARLFWLLYASRAIMPTTILHDNNTDQQAAEQTSCEISRNVAMALRATGITQSGQAPGTR